MFTDEARLGCRSPLVLQKLGYDLRASLEETFRAPLPQAMKDLSDRLPGASERRDAPERPRIADRGDTIL